MTVGSTEDPSGDMSNADTLLLSWAEPALPTWRSQHKQDQELLKPSLQTKGWGGSPSSHSQGKWADKEESQLGFLRSSVFPSVPYQGKSTPGRAYLGTSRPLQPWFLQLCSTWHGVTGNLCWGNTTPGQLSLFSQVEEKSITGAKQVGQSHLCTQFSENTLKIYFKYIIKGSPFNFKNTRHSINDSQFMKATTLKCYKSFTTPRY